MEYFFWMRHHLWLALMADAVDCLSAASLIFLPDLDSRVFKKASCSPLSKRQITMDLC
jgi:hypothetical protein